MNLHKSIYCLTARSTVDELCFVSLWSKYTETTLKKKENSKYNKNPILLIEALFQFIVYFYFAITLVIIIQIWFYHFNTFDSLIREVGTINWHNWHFLLAALVLNRGASFQNRLCSQQFI